MCRYQRKPRTKANRRSPWWQPCTQQSQVAFFLFKMKFLSIPTFVPGEAREASEYEVDKAPPERARLGPSPLGSEGTGVGAGTPDSVSLLLGTKQDLPSVGAE